MFTLENGRTITLRKLIETGFRAKKLAPEPLLICDLVGHFQEGHRFAEASEMEDLRTLPADQIEPALARLLQAAQNRQQNKSL